MCYHCRIGHICGHFSWSSEIEKECEEKVHALQNDDNRPCPEQRLLFYRSEATPCPDCINLDSLPIFCLRNSCRLLYLHPGKHNYFTNHYKCALRGCIRQYHHHGLHYTVLPRRMLGNSFRYGYNELHAPHSFSASIYYREHHGSELPDCGTLGCTMGSGHPGPHMSGFQLCSDLDCDLDPDHAGPHHNQFITCLFEKCHLQRGHTGEHHCLEGCQKIDCRICTWRGKFALSSRSAKDAATKKVDPMVLLNLLVLCAMGDYPAEVDGKALDQGTLLQLFTKVEPLLKAASAWSAPEHRLKPEPRHQRPTIQLRSDPNSPCMLQLRLIRNRRKMRFRIAEMKKAATEQTQMPSFLYHRLDVSGRQIRLFELVPVENGFDIQGIFHHVDLSTQPKYTALSYAWGDSTKQKSIKVLGGGRIKVGINLWNFLHRQNSICTEPKYFWIDAICIDQASIHERNHQVGLMKDIYKQATDVYVWLGIESDNSDLAMEFAGRKASDPLQKRAEGYYPVWKRPEGKALAALCSRQYWRRMWIIQEVINAKDITVWCGSKSFPWRALEAIYLKLKKIEDKNWLLHHEYAEAVLSSEACTMVWQRAHWRHPQTPQPSLQVLIEVFHDWKCTDLRDKVFALVGLADAHTAITPDYNLPAAEVYFRVQQKHPGAKPQFFNTLSQILGVSGKDVGFYGQDLLVNLCTRQNEDNLLTLYTGLNTRPVHQSSLF